MGFVTDVLGVGQGADKGMNWQAGGVDLMKPVTQDQITGGYNRTEQGLNWQQDFLNALQGQNGIGNQNQVYAQAQGLQDQLQGMANGTGPNPALAQLQAQTGQNVAQQAALMGSQRGVGSNPALLARQAAQQGAQIQQNAVGQASTMQAQQQLAAVGALQNQQNLLGNLAGTQVAQRSNALGNYNQFAQNQYGQLLGAAAQYNNAGVANQQSKNSANASIQGGIAGMQGQLFGGGIGGASQALTMAPAAAAAAHGGLIQKYADGGFTLTPGNLSSNLSISQFQNPAVGPQKIEGPKSFVGQHLNSKNAFSQGFDQAYGQGTERGVDPMYAAGQGIGKGLGMGIGSLFRSSPNTPMSDAGYQRPELGSQFASPGPSLGNYDLGKADGGEIESGIPEEGIPEAPPIPGSGQKKSDSGSTLKSLAPLAKLALLRSGGKVPGKAKVEGDSYANDTVPALLSSGEIVLPRSVTQSRDPVRGAADFVAAILAKNQMKKKT